MGLLLRKHASMVRGDGKSAELINSYFALIFSAKRNFVQMYPDRIQKKGIATQDK